MGNPYGYTNDAIDEPWNDHPCTRRCVDCPDWVFIGTVTEGNEAFREHLKELHPERLNGKRKSRSSLRTPSKDQANRARLSRAGQANGAKIVMDAMQEKMLIALYLEGLPVSGICRERWRGYGYKSAESLEASLYRALRRRGIERRRYAA